MSCGVGRRRSSDLAVALAGSYSSDSSPTLGTSTCCGCSPKKKTKLKKKKVIQQKSNGDKFQTHTHQPPKKLIILNFTGIIWEL